MSYLYIYYIVIGVSCTPMNGVSCTLAFKVIILVFNRVKVSTNLYKRIIHMSVLPFFIIHLEIMDIHNNSPSTKFHISMYHILHLRGLLCEAWPKSQRCNVGPIKEYISNDKGRG